MGEDSSGERNPNTPESPQAKPEAAGPSKAEVRQSALQEVAQLGTAMENRTKELVGKSESPTVGLLERDAVRRKLVETGVLSPQSGESFKALYREGYNGAMLSLDGIKQTPYARYTGDHPLAGLREIPNEAAQIESGAMKVVGDCEAGWATPGAFNEALHQEIDNLKMIKAGEGGGIQANPDSLKKGFSGLQEQIDEAKVDMASRMMASQAELPRPLADWRQRFVDAKSKGKDTRAEFTRFMGINSLSQSLDSALLTYKEQYEQQRTPETSEALRTVRRTELVGVADSTKVRSLERNLQG